jgi:ribosomal protein S18 acetylase RimI-like enzyme
MTIDIRAAAAGDLEGIVAVFLACWRGSYATVLPSPVIDGMTDDGALALWSAALGRPGSETLVAERSPGGEVLGVTRFSSSADAGTVDSLYVSPDAQGLGVGARLLEAATDALARRGLASARLWVFKANAPSLGFYERHGWRADGGERVEAAYGEPELQLVRALPARVPTANGGPR